MPLFPQLEQQHTQQIVTDTFGGYNHQLKVPDGEWYNTQNLTTDYSPMLANRAKRGNTGKSAVALAEKKNLAYVGTDGTLYYNWLPTNLTGLSTSSNMLPKQIVSMGAYLVIFPDKKYYNTEDGTDFGSLEAHYTRNTVTSNQGVAYRMVRAEGTAVSAPAQQTAPANPQNGDYWIDTSGSPHVLKQWSDSAGDWISVETVYIKVTFQTLGVIKRYFKELDGVTISGSSVDAVNGDHIIFAMGGRAQSEGDSGERDWIMIAGLLSSSSTASDSVTIDRNIPDLNFVCEAQNRLWGCYYGLKDGQAINEIYCCALGDFRNWYQFQGISTDSWVGTVGSDGQWTGAVNYLGYPTFFKENRIHRVTVSTTGAHQIDETVCRGVQKGSEKSLVVVNETLYYKSRSDVCAYQGGFPSGVSAALGTESYHAAAAGAVGSKYYISMLDSSNAAHTFVYDIGKSIWMREDNTRFTEFARVDNELYGLKNTSTNNIVTMLGSLPVTGTTAESAVSWEAVSGIQYYEYPDNKRLSRYNIRMKMAQGASLAVYLQYDSDGTWLSAGSVTATAANIDSYLFPVRPHRCDHLQIKLVGSGDIQIYSIAKILEVGSDYR